MPNSADSVAYGGAYVLCYQMPGLSQDPLQHASHFLREAGWEVIGVQESPELTLREDAPDEEHFDQALLEDEAYIFHQWEVDDAGDETRH